MHRRTTMIIAVLATSLRIAAVEPSIAAQYPGDVGIDRDPRVLLSTDFTAADWRQPWDAKEQPTAVTVVEDAAHGFVPFAEQALRVTVEQGKHYGTSMAYRFKQHTGSEPEEIYFRYYLRFGSSWKPSKTSGKLPGIGGTYDRAGWGGRAADGRNGWSARGLFQAAGDGRTPIGFYCYHADMGRWGSEWVWKQDERGFLANDRWYCIEHHVRLNTPAAGGQGDGAKDGVLRGWVDGELAFAKEDVCFRHTGELKIDRVWIDVYYGGDATSPHDMHLYIDNVVIATSYIGPVAKPPAKRAAKPSSASAPPTKAAPGPLPDAAVQASYRQLLRDSVAEALAEGRHPRFHLALLRGEAVVQGMDGDLVDLSAAGSSARMSIRLFATMTPDDAASLAVGLVRPGVAESHALAAFFLLIAGDRSQAEAHLAQAGGAGDVVRKMFE